VQRARRRRHVWIAGLLVLASAGITQACSGRPIAQSTVAPTRSSTATTRPSLAVSPTVASTRTAIRSSATPTASPTLTSTPLPTESPTPSYTPAPTLTPTATPTPEPVVYVVGAGDGLLAIAREFGVSAEDLAEANGIDPEDILSIGQELVIPVEPETTGPASPTDIPTERATASATATATATPTASSTPVATATAPPTGSPTLVETATATPSPRTPAATARRTAPEAETPTASRTVPPTATAEPTMVADIIHTVEQGEYLGLIASRYGIDADVIAKANGITSDSVLRIGQKLLIPSVPVTPTATQRPTQESLVEEATSAPDQPLADIIHTVEQGEYLGLIALEYGVDSELIAEANDLTEDTVLRIGQELIIPSIPVTPSPTVTSTPTFTPSPTPTLTPTLVRRMETYPYRAPFLLGPVQNASYRGSEANILLNWTSVGILGANEWYRVQMRPIGRREDAIEFWTKATSWRPDASMVPESWADAVHLSWSVTVVERLPSNPPWRALSPTSRPRLLSWNRQTLSP
jgi:LysM repeat protein